MILFIFIIPDLSDSLSCRTETEFSETFDFSQALLVEGSLGVKLPTIWTDEKQRWEESEKRKEERRSKRESLRRKKIQVCEKVAKHCVFPMICGSGGSKSRLAKAAGAEPAGQMRDDKLHTVVARSTFPSQNAQNTSAPEHL